MLSQGLRDGGGDPADPLCPPPVTAAASGQLQQVVQESLDLRPPNFKPGEGRDGDTEEWGGQRGIPRTGDRGMLRDDDVDGGDKGGGVRVGGGAPLGHEKEDKDGGDTGWE